jgi:hypothetical protein
MLSALLAFALFPFVGAVCGVLVLGLLAFAIPKGLRKFTSGSIQSQKSRFFAGVSIFNAPAPGLVSVVFHAYSGVLVFTHQVEYRFWASPADARTILARMNKYNWTRGFFAYGALFIPLLSWANLAAQKRSIARQESATSVVP